MTRSDAPTISIIEDDEAVRESLVALVDCEGYRSTTFPDAESFLQADDAKVDFLVVDVRLPGMSGIELLEQLAASGVSRPAVIVTGHVDSEELRQSTQLSDVVFLSKPVEPENLLRIIADSLASSR